jgi:amidase
MPATRAALYTIKPTVGIVSRTGVIPVSPFFDSPGPMAKCAQDIADLLDVMVDETMIERPVGGYRSCLTDSFQDIKIGALDPTVWNFPERDEGATKQMVTPPVSSGEQARTLTHSQIADINAAYARIRPLAKRFVSNLPSPQ